MISEDRSGFGGNSLTAAQNIIEDAWNELRSSFYVQLRMSSGFMRPPDMSYEEAERRSRLGCSLLKRLDALDSDCLPHDIALTLRLVRFRAQTWAREQSWYWTVCDPFGTGGFGIFLPTAYCGGVLLNLVGSRLASFTFDSSGDTDRYLAFVADYVRLLDQVTERTSGQAQRGMRMPVAQVHQARALLTALKDRTRAILRVSPDRLKGMPGESFNLELENSIVNCVDPAFQRALMGLSATYLAQAPETVGIAQYGSGAEIYAELVKLHTTLDISAEEVHERGLGRMAEIHASMHEIRDEVGFRGDGPGFLAHLNKDPRWRADTVEGVTAVFQRYIDRLEPHIDDYFSLKPSAAYGVAPLPEALQGSMTFGYYDEPRPDRRKGIYLFNSSNLTNQGLFIVGALTYHELMPGHHLHLATQRENTSLHPFRANNFVTAYNEGWAEYAATLAAEIGLYEAPEERYGRLVMDAFLTCRLVVDTGMNVLGWPLDQAREYMRAHSGMPESVIQTELIRYSCDIPGQALAYKVGDTQILKLRERMRAELGKCFDIREFHKAILAPGALPLVDVEWHIDHEIERLRTRV